MANHKSALKRIRRNEAVRLRNRYQHKTVRNAIKKLRNEEDKKAAELSIKRAKEIKKGLDDLKRAAMQTQQVASDEWAKQLYGRFSPVEVKIPHPDASGHVKVTQTPVPVDTVEKELEAKPADY